MPVQTSAILAKPWRNELPSLLDTVATCETIKFCDGGMIVRHADGHMILFNGPLREAETFATRCKFTLAQRADPETYGRED